MGGWSKFGGFRAVWGFRSLELRSRSLGFRVDRLGVSGFGVGDVRDLGRPGCRAFTPRASPMRFRVWGLGFRVVLGSGFRVRGLGFGV